MQQQSADTSLLFEFVKQLHTCMQTDQLEPALCKPALAGVARLAIANFNINNHREQEPPRYGAWYDVRVSTSTLSAESILTIVRLLVQLQLTGDIPLLLAKIAIAGDELEAAPLEEIMLPFLRDLLRFAKANGMNYTEASYRNLFIAALGRYVKTALPPQVPAPRAIEPRQVGCGCKHCQKLDRFLANPELKEESFKEYVKERRHLEERLRRIKNRSLLSWASRREGAGPEVLRISKKNGEFEFMEWMKRRARVCDKLNQVASWEDLNALLERSFIDIMCQAKLMPTTVFPERLPSDLPLFREPERAELWLQKCYVADDRAIVSQKELCDSYHAVMGAVPSREQQLPTAQLLSMIPAVFAGAHVQNDNLNLISGIRRWTWWQDGHKNAAAPLTSLSRAPADHAGPSNGTQGVSRKRPIDVVDLGSPP